MTRSYSRPSSLRTFSMAAFMRRAFSGLLKSTEGSFWKVAGIWALLTVAEMRVPSRAGVVVVAISASSQVFISAVLIDAVRSGGMRHRRVPSSNDKRGRGLCLVRLALGSDLNSILRRGWRRLLFVFKNSCVLPHQRAWAVILLYSLTLWPLTDGFVDFQLPNPTHVKVAKTALVLFPGGSAIGYPNRYGKLYTVSEEVSSFIFCQPHRRKECEVVMTVFGGGNYFVNIELGNLPIKIAGYTSFNALNGKRKRSVIENSLAGFDGYGSWFLATTNLGLRQKPIRLQIHPLSHPSFLDVGLSSDNFPSERQEPYLESTDYNQEQIEAPKAPIRPIPLGRSYRHGRKFADHHGMLCIVLALLGAMPLGGFGLFCAIDNRRLWGWCLVGITLALAVLGCVSRAIGCLQWDWRTCLCDGQEHSQRDVFHGGKIVRPMSRYPSTPDGSPSRCPSPPRSGGRERPRRAWRCEIG